MNWRLESGDRFEFNVVPVGERLTAAFDVTDNVSVPAGAAIFEMRPIPGLADEAAAIRPMARRTEIPEQGLAFRKHRRIWRGCQGGHVRLELGKRGLFEFLSDLHLGLVFRGHEPALAEDVIVNQVERGKEDGEVEQPYPPARQFVVQFANAVVLVIEQ